MSGSADASRNVKNVLIVGGSYFAGRVCVEELVKQPGVAVHVFNRGRKPLNMPGVSELKGDREAPDQIRDAIPAREWDAVIDFCAYAPSHVDLLLRHLPGSVRHYILISTTSVLKRTLSLPAAEDGPTLTGPDRALGAHGEYAFDKLRAERTAHETCRASGIALTVLRPAIIYGYYNYAPRESYFFDHLRNRTPLVVPSEDLALFSFIWVVDMAKLIVKCIGDERTHAETFNLASDELVSYARIVEVLEEITGRPIEPIRMPAVEIDRQGIPLPFPLSEHLLYSGAKIQRLFDFAYTPFKRGLREALKYYLLVARHNARDAS